MNIKNASQDTSANPCKDSLTCPERDAHEGAHNDDTDAPSNNQPPHGHVSYGLPAFLKWCHPETPWDADILVTKYGYWDDHDVDELADDIHAERPPNPSGGHQ